MTLVVVVGALVVIGVFAVVMFRALARAGRTDARRADVERIAELPVAIVTARVTVDVIAPQPAVATLTSRAVRSNPAVFVATLWPGIDSEDLTDDDHVDDDRHDSDDDNDDLPEEADDEVLDALRRRREMIAAAFAAIVGLAARGSVRLAIERVDRVADPADPAPATGLAPRGLLVRRLVEGPFDEAGLELGILGHLPLAVDVPIAELREVLEALHLEPPTTTTNTRALADHLGAFVADHGEVWHQLRAALAR